MNRDELALEIFLKKLPPGHVNDQTRAGIESAVAQAYEVADLFLRKRSEIESAERRAQLGIPETES